MTQQEIKVVRDMYAPHALWFATFGDYDFGCLMGTGHTPLNAIVDLLDAEENTKLPASYCHISGRRCTCTTPVLCTGAR